MSAPNRSPGEIITFYSYKGGTGRTMALANVACLLAERGASTDRVLVVDWDLEAPGLHRFLPPRLGSSDRDLDLGLDAGPGLIDFFISLTAELPSDPATSEEAGDAALAAALARVNVQSFISDTSVSGVSILRAGHNADGKYSTRVNTFDWEDLFHRAPSVYRTFAERLAATYRYVLIDSRTGVTDISGICTYLLPEKLVVVFTPNRQSLSGIRELVHRAMAYRRNSDDLRPLLIFPLPSRIEGSLEDLRKVWRFGDPDRAITGYQPMFEELLAQTYGVKQCDLDKYFEDVQIQQTPDYAYGEEIAARRQEDRFSLGRSYRVFAEWLTSGSPPWERPLDASVPQEPHAAPTPTSGHAIPEERRRLESEPALKHGSGSPLSRSLKVFLSSSSQDRERIRPIVKALQEAGLTVWWDRTVPAGSSFEQAIARELDSSDAIIVCWSKTSVASAWILEEASEGLRRGVLIPVLLDDVSPPLTFRTIQSADLRRDPTSGIAKLVEAVERVAHGVPGTAASPQVIPPVPTPPARGTPAASAPLPAPTAALVPTSLRLWILGGAVAVVVLLALLVFVRSPSPTLPGNSTGPGITAPPPSNSTSSAPPPVIPPPPPVTSKVTVPDFSGLETAFATKTAELIGLRLVMTDGRGSQSSYLEGVVTGQSPAPQSLVDKGSQVQLRIEARTVVVPTLTGMTLDRALITLERASLRLSIAEARPVGDAKPGTIITQNPQPGAKVAAGAQINVFVVRQPQ